MTKNLPLHHQGDSWVFVSPTTHPLPYDSKKRSLESGLLCQHNAAFNSKDLSLVQMTK